MGLYGILVVTSAPTGSAAGCAYRHGLLCALRYNAEVPLLLSEIDQVQNNAVDTAVATRAFQRNAQCGPAARGCGNPLVDVPDRYPPAVNYTPLYYLINGVAFDKTNATGSLFPASPAAADGQRACTHGECRPAHARALDCRIADRASPNLQLAGGSR